MSKKKKQKFARGSEFPTYPAGKRGPSPVGSFLDEAPTFVDGARLAETAASLRYRKAIGCDHPRDVSCFDADRATIKRVLTEQLDADQKAKADTVWFTLDTAPGTALCDALDASKRGGTLAEQAAANDRLKAALKAELDKQRTSAAKAVTDRHYGSSGAKAVGERERAKNLAAEASRFKTVGEETVTVNPNTTNLKAALKEVGDAFKGKTTVSFTPPLGEIGNYGGGSELYEDLVKARDLLAADPAWTLPKPKPGGWKVEELSKPKSGYEPPPTHYATPGGIDPWAVWDAFDLDRYTANAVKYLLRAGKKDIAPRLDDLKKARNYINKAIEREENK